MPWKKSEPMEQRVEFALKARNSENFRALCQEYGISTKTGSALNRLSAIGYFIRALGENDYGYCTPRVPTYTAYNEVVAVMKSRFLFGPPKVKFETGSGILIFPSKRPEGE